MDSSLIFLAVIGIWLVYLVPRWVARRHRASAERPEDRFSSSMRVLDRTAGGEPSRQASRGYLLNGTNEETSPDRPTHFDRRRPASGPRARRSSGRGLARALLFLVLAGCVLVVPGAAVLAQRGALGWAVCVTAGVIGFLAFATLRATAQSRSRQVPAPVSSPLPVVAEPTPARTPKARPRDELFDEESHRLVELAAAEAVLESARREREAARANIEPGQWLPTEVPLPTYLLQPEAPQRRPAPEPASAAAGTEIDLSWYDQHAEDHVPAESAAQARARKARQALDDFPLRRASGH